MTIAHDAFSSPANDGTGNLSWTHTPVGTPRGVIVLVGENGTSDQVASVTYGGVAMTRVRFLSGTNIQGFGLWIYFLGEGIPTGAQTVVVTVSGGNSKHAGAFTVTAAQNTVLVASSGAVDGTMTSGEFSAGALTLDAQNSYLAAAAIIHNNTAAQINASTGWTTGDEEDFGASDVFVYSRRNTLATGSYSTPGPWTLTNNSQGAAMVAVAIREAISVPVGVDAQLIWNTQVILPAPELTRTELQAAALEAILAPGTQIVHRVDIYESDGATMYRRDAAFLDYSVSVDATRAVRRTLDLTLYNDADLAPRPGGFWYDKIIKVYRGVHLDGYDVDFFWPLGVFGIDPGTLNTQTFPRLPITVSASDVMAALGRAKFGVPTTFATGQALEHVVETIAMLGGHSKLRLHATGKTLGRDFTFEADTTVGDALGQLAAAFGLDVYADAFDYLVMRPLDDPAVAAPFLTYQPGVMGNVAGISWQATSERLYNDVWVSGESSDAAVPPVFAHAENTNPASPTHIREDGVPGGLPRTTYRYVSPLLTTEEQCADTAASILQRVALEDVAADAEVLVVPWLEENRVVRIVDDNPPPGEPAAQRYLLVSFPFTSAPGSHTVKAKRVVPVG